MVSLQNPEFEKMPLDLALKFTTFRWGDVDWGYTNGLLTWNEVVAISKFRLSEPMDNYYYCNLLELANANESNIWQINYFIKNLIEIEPTEEHESKRKFLCLSLIWLYHKRNFLNDDPLEFISAIFADFDYPEEISHLVHFMPDIRGYYRAAKTKEENRKLRFNQWVLFLENNGYYPTLLEECVNK